MGGRLPRRRPTEAVAGAGRDEDDGSARIDGIDRGDLEADWKYNGTGEEENGRDGPAGRLLPAVVDGDEEGRPVDESRHGGAARGGEEDAKGTEGQEDEGGVHPGEDAPGDEQEPPPPPYQAEAGPDDAVALPKGTSRPGDDPHPAGEDDRRGGVSAGQECR